MQKQLEDILDEVEIPSNLLGYQYWIDILNLAVTYKNTTYKYPISDFYRRLAKIHNVSQSSVERCLRTAREHSYINVKGNSQFLAELIKLYRRYDNE